MKIPSRGALEHVAPALPQGTTVRPRPLSVAAKPGPTGTSGRRLNPGAPDASFQPRPSRSAGRPIHWIEAVNSQVALAPISALDLKVRPEKPSPLDEPSTPGPYKLASVPSLPAYRAGAGKPAGPLTRGYRQGMGEIQKLFRWINESAYLVSVPFLMCLLLGLALPNHNLVVLGASAVVLLNIGRIVAGLANLIVIPFRESLIEGILFLIPPISLFYLAQRWNKVRKPVRRIVGPIFTIGLVALALVVEPWLKGKGKPQGSTEDQARSGLQSMKTDIKGELGKVRSLKAQGLEKLEQKAGAVVKSVESGTLLQSLEEQAKNAGQVLGTPESRAKGASNPR
jgi:hypothetical protein